MNLANGHYICPFSSRLCLILRGLFHNINSEPLPISMGQKNKKRKEKKLAVVIRRVFADLSMLPLTR